MKKGIPRFCEKHQQQKIKRISHEKIGRIVVHWVCKKCAYESSRKSMKKHPRQYKYRKLNSYYKYAYGITLNDFRNLFKNQKGQCAICKKKLIKKTRRKNTACIDHDHNSNKIRGILCEKCNVVLGGFQDSIDLLKSAIKYLQK